MFSLATSDPIKESHHIGSHLESHRIIQSSPEQIESWRPKTAANNNNNNNNSGILQEVKKVEKASPCHVQETLLRSIPNQMLSCHRKHKGLLIFEDLQF